MSSSQQRVQQSRNPTLPAATTPEQRYWRGFTSTQLVKEHNSVTHICFNPQKPHDFAVTSSTRVQVFSSKTRQVNKTFSRFTDTVYSGEYRHDGKLLVAGTAQGIVQVYDAIQPRTLLVNLQPTTHPVHVTKFHPFQSSQLLVASDDRAARIYDIAQTQTPLAVFKDHGDYVRSATYIAGSNLVATGCYDGFLRVFDPREGSRDAVMSFATNSPVEDILSVSGSNLVSCGDNSIKVWDLSASKKSHEMTNFSKTVTCLADAGDRGILAGSVDGHVKVFDPTVPTWDVKFGWKFGSGVLSCGVSPNHRHLVVGLTSGLLAIRTRKTEPRVKQGAKTEKSRSAMRMLRGAEYHGETEHHVVSDKPRQSKKLKTFEKHLNAFKWSDALDSAFVEGHSKELTVTVLEELRKRGKVRAALSGRDATGLEPLITWCIKGMEDVRSFPIVADYLGAVVDMYSELMESSPILEELILSVQKKLAGEIDKAKEARRIDGMLQLLSVG